MRERECEREGERERDGEIERDGETEDCYDCHHLGHFQGLLGFKSYLQINTISS